MDTSRAYFSTSYVVAGDVIGLLRGQPYVAHHEAFRVSSDYVFVDRPVDYANIPARTYTDSRGQRGSDREGREAPPATTRWPAVVSSTQRRVWRRRRRSGFQKLVFEANNTANFWVAHLIGSQATEMISELVLAKNWRPPRRKSSDVDPHPTYSEAIMEAAGQGLGESIHI